jgi:solute:Na+ symporter, SSS family
MKLYPLDILIFAGFAITVVTVGMIKSRNEKSSEDYFLAGRGLSWWLIGFSLIAANISSEQFVGMSGNAACHVGLAIASYEWLAAITLVVVAFFFLPYFLRAGIYTIPEFLEQRYNSATRSIMALFMVLIYILLVASVTYSGALTIQTLFEGQSLFGIPMNLVTGTWLIGLIAGLYVAFGGLKACAWADLLQGTALIAGGAVIAFFGFQWLGRTPVGELFSLAAVPANLSDNAGGWTKFMAINSDKLHMFLPRGDNILPWTAVVIALWIPNFYYWGVNQYIVQRTLGSKSLLQGQRGIVFAAALKLIIPFIVIFPGIMAFNLFADKMKAPATETNAPILAGFEAAKANPAAAGFVYEFEPEWAQQNPQLAEAMDRFNQAAKRAAAESGRTLDKHKLIAYKWDMAFGLLVKQVLPEGTGLRGFVMAAILGAIVSSLAAMLNAASTIFAMDLYKKHFVPSASSTHVVGLGRICVGVFMVIGCLLAPMLGNPKVPNSIFVIIQESQGYISSGILGAFVFGLLVPKAPPLAGVVGLLSNPVSYGLLAVYVPQVQFVDRMTISFAIVIVMMVIITLIRPRPVPMEYKTNTTIDLRTSYGAMAFGGLVIVATVGLYLYFW